MMTDAVFAALAPNLVGSAQFDSFEGIFDFVSKAASNERIVFIIDEYPYLAKECGFMNSLFQKYADHNWKDTQLFLILCGSLVSFMRDDVLGESAPLHGRSTLELKIRPMGYRDAAGFVPNYSNEDKAIVYGLTGGIPKYLEQFDPEKTLDENIVEQFYTSTGYFTEEQLQTLITADRSNPVAFNSIIEAVASGKTKYGEIATAAGLREISYYLKALVGADLLEKRLSNGRPYYVLADSMVEFWFRYVSRACSLVNAGRGQLYYESQVKGRIHEFMGKVFENMARQYLFANMGTDRIPWLATEIDEYQTGIKDASGKVRQVEIDLLGKNGKSIVFAGECKFRNEKFDVAELEKFADKVALLPVQSPGMVLFSLSGFTFTTGESSAALVDIDEMYAS